MNELHIYLMLLKLTRAEEQLFLMLYLIYKSENKNEVYHVDELAKLSMLSKNETIDLLNKLTVRNIVGRIRREGLISDVISENFDQDFLNVLYNKNNPLESAVQKTGFKIINNETTYVFNVVERSWKFQNKTVLVKQLKKLKKIVPDNKFVEYLLNGFNNGAKGGTRLKSSMSIRNNWTVNSSMEIFLDLYTANYGRVYKVSRLDYKHMRALLIQLSDSQLSKNSLELFFKHAFNEVAKMNYVLQISGLRYHANSYMANSGTKARN